MGGGALGGWGNSGGALEVWALVGGTSGGGH